MTRTKLVWLSKIDYLQPAFWAGNQTGEVVIEQYLSVICNFWSACKALIPALLQLFQPEEIIVICVEEEFWVKIGWKERDRVTERKQEVKGVKGARKDTKIGRIRREERQREQEKALTKKANIHRCRATLEGNTKSSRKQTKKRSSTKIDELQRIRERRRGKLCLMLGFFFYVKARKNSNLLYQLLIDTSFSL